ncbi:MAG: methyltransferase domain-containing protein [Acidobacteriota bacterium]
MHDGERAFLARHLDVFCCPACHGHLDIEEDGLRCRACQCAHPVTDGVIQLFCPNQWAPGRDDVTERIKAFYEEYPFPNYDDFDNVGSLIDKARRGLFAKLLDDQIPFGARVLECGCGTGQLTNFLSVANRTVIGTDICLNSLRLGQRFKEKNDLQTAHFYQMNLFRPCFRPGSFDLVVSNGVLHHTSDPFLAFQAIARLVRPRGYILVGLYHKYGRLATDLRRLIFNASGDKGKFLDRHVVNPGLSLAKRTAWFMDQYKNPHESKHTVGEVLGWLAHTGFTFVHALPKTTPFARLGEHEQIFEPDRLGSPFERGLVNLGMIVTGHLEGGFFTVIARKAAA